jgi:hypothetical protein
MKIHVDTGERAELIVASRCPSNAAVMITTDMGERIAQVLVEDGLLSEVVEYTIRRHRDRPIEDRLTLWAHLVSEHAGCYGLDLSLRELEEIHAHEHRGPGTIRNHDPLSRQFRIAKIIYVLGEAEVGVADMEDSELRLHAKRVNAEIALREKRANEPEPDDDPYEESRREAGYEIPKD